MSCDRLPGMGEHQPQCAYRQMLAAAIAELRQSDFSG